MLDKFKFIGEFLVVFKIVYKLFYPLAKDNLLLKAFKTYFF